MANTKVKVEDDGPYEIEGAFTIVDELGNTFETKRTVTLCRCGRSDEKPFCDGTHEDIGFDSKPRADDLMVEV